MKWYLVILCLLSHVARCQIENLNYLSWHPSRRLTVADFDIKVKASASTPSVAQFTIWFSANHLNLLTGNRKYKVVNSFIKLASWIDTTANVAVTLRYQQTLFDLSEIYTRQLRRDLHLNRKKLRLTPNFVEQLNAQAMAEFAERRIQYDQETNYGTLVLEQKRWELAVQAELSALAEYTLN